jgi:hypothetical protein
MSHKRIWSVSRAFLLLLAATALPWRKAFAQQVTSSVHPTTPLVANAERRTGAVEVDGRLNEAAWEKATPISGFRQFRPDEGLPASLPTEVRILFDEQALYIGARMFDPGGRRSIRAPLARRDQLLDGNGNNGAFNSLTSDKFVVVIDPYHNHLDQALFEVNPAGVRGDSFNGDDSWDPIWEAAAAIDSTGWTAEIRIPYSQLRFSREESQTWGLQLWRYADRLNERDMWAFWRRSESGGPSFYGHLAGVQVASRPRQLELLPFVVTRNRYAPDSPGDPYHTGSDTRLSVGGDVKYLLTSNLTLDATINPDFGQVEVDPASLNLSAFETFYDEKRPFFVAGRSAFDFGGMSCYFCSNNSSLDVFYSRRIGRPPQLGGYVDDRAAYRDVPDNATILGAAKLTGRTKGGYTIGILDALVDREIARFLPAPGMPEREQVVEPMSNYLVARVKKDLNDGSTTVGAIVTSALRRIGEDTVVADRLRRHATALGVDWDHTWGHRTYSWTGTVVASEIAGSPAALALVQRSSAHYFQRPDREVSSDGVFDTRYDTTISSLRGYGLYTRLAKESGNWLWETAQNWRSPGFETNDLSYLDRADYRWMNANIVRNVTKPTRMYRSIFTSLGGQQQFNYDGLRNDLQTQIYYGMEFANYWNLRSFVIHSAPVFDDRATRGGPVVKSNGYNFGHVQVSTDPRRPAVFDLSLETSRGVHEPTRMTRLQPGVAVKPAASVFIQFAPSYEDAERSAQYVTAYADPTATAFDGTRYIFSRIRTKTLSLETRVNWTLTSNLSLQVYAQPFIASGDYQRFREYAAPRSGELLDYGQGLGTIQHNASAHTYTLDPDGSGPAAAHTIDDPNFSARSLRGTAVLRWEYRPGSTIFLAWTQQRFGSSTDGTFDFNRDRVALLRDHPDNVFVLKVNYWLGR